MIKPPRTYPTPMTRVSRVIGYEVMRGGLRLSFSAGGALLATFAASLFSVAVTAQPLAPDTGLTGRDIIPTDLPARASTVQPDNQPLSLLPGTIPTDTRIEQEIDVPSLADQYQRTITGQPPLRPSRQQSSKAIARPVNKQSSPPSPTPRATSQPAVAMQRRPLSGTIETAEPSGNDQFLIQLGAFRDAFTAETYWASFSIRYPELSRSHEKKIVAADLGNRGIYHRLQLVGFKNSGSAQKQCRQLKADGTDCFATAR